MVKRRIYFEPFSIGMFAAVQAFQPPRRQAVFLIPLLLRSSTARALVCSFCQAQ